MDMEEGELSDSSGGRHPAEDLIIQKALRRAAAAEASTTDLRHSHEQVCHRLYHTSCLSTAARARSAR